VVSATVEALQLAEFCLNQIAASRGAQARHIVLLGTSKTLEHLAETLNATSDKVAIYLPDELCGWIGSLGQYKSAAGMDTWVLH
jgi:hypothetical protein